MTRLYFCLVLECKHIGSISEVFEYSMYKNSLSFLLQSANWIQEQFHQAEIDEIEKLFNDNQ